MPIPQKYPLYRQVIAWLLVLTIGLMANPQNPEVRHGDVEFNFDNPGELFIDQLSDKAIIDWESFDIDAGELTQFLQQNSKSMALNRVFSGNPSEIHGQLQANGQLFLINPNGILVGPNGQIDTAGFLASTLDVSDAEFLNGGDMTFSGGSSAAVVNLGTINAIDGDIFLIAKEVSNEGTLNAAEGTVGLAAGAEVRVATLGDERVTIAPGGEGTVTNKGTINAMTAELKAAGGNQYALAINNEGVVRAKSFESRGGRLYLSASGGRIVNTGSLQASKSVDVRSVGSVHSEGSIRVVDEETGNGGTAVIAADQVRILGSVDASGLEAGSVDIAAVTGAQIDGSVRANSTAGVGGLVTVTGAEIGVGATGSVRADGATDGGLVSVGRTSRSEVPGNETDQEVRATSIRTEAGSKISASGAAGAGGDVLLFADTNESEMRLGGEIRANGGGAAGGEVLALGHDIRVEQSGVIKANGETDGGIIRMEGSGDVHVAGQMQAKGSTGDGGFVHVTGENVTFTETSKVDARGDRDGGMVQIDADDEGTVRVAGEIIVTGGRDGGMIAMTGGDIVVTETGALDASGGRHGGVITAEAENSATINGQLLAVGGTGDGGVITVTGENVTIGQTGVLDASGGTNGGLITVEGGDTVNFNGTARATGGSGDGGVINVLGENVNVGSTALLDASGAVDGGVITVDGDNVNVAEGAQLMANASSGVAGAISIAGAESVDFGGSAEASSGIRQNSGVPAGVDVVGILANSATARLGGIIDITAPELNFFGSANIDASGAAGGGTIRIGGGLRGLDADLANATNTTISADAVLRADATEDGDGGLVVTFAEETLAMAGSASSQGGSLGGDGGFVEFSGKKEVFFHRLADQVELSAAAGESGVLLIDPNDISIIDGSGSPLGGNRVNSNTLNDQDIADFLTNVGSLTIETSGTGGSGDVTVDGAANITWGSNSTLSVRADRDFNALTGSLLNATGSGRLFVTAQRTARIGGTIRANANSLNLTGNGQNGAIGTVGVDIDGGLIEVTGGGSVSLNGTGGTGSGDSNIGVRLINGGMIDSQHGGSISIRGTGGRSGENGNIGVQIAGPGSKIVSAGRVYISATGNGAGNDNYGLSIESGGSIEMTATGAFLEDLTIDANGGSGDSSNHGMRISGPNSKIATVDADISIEAEGKGSGSNNRGMFLTDGGVIESTGVGANAGTISIDGTGSRGAGGNAGVFISSAGSKISSVDGAVMITGEASSGTAAGNSGVVVSNGAAIESIGTGSSAATITIVGTGQNGMDQNYGVGVESGARISSVDGDVNVNGQGGNRGSNNNGVHVSAGVIESTGTSGEAANLVITGRSGAGLAGTSNYGVNLEEDGVIRVAAGDATITGTGGSSSGSEGIRLSEVNGGRLITDGAGNIMIEATSRGGAVDFIAGADSLIGDGVAAGAATNPATGDIIIRADSIEWTGSEMKVQSAGNLTFLPRTDGASIGVGSGAAGDLNVDDTELGFLQDGFSSINFGEVGFGNVEVANPAAFSDPVVISGVDLNVNSISSTDDLTLQSDNNLTVTGAVQSVNGDVLIGAVNDLTAGAGASFSSAAAGELRFYVGGDDNVDPAALLNGVAHGATPFPNNQGTHQFRAGPYAPQAGTNFAYYDFAPFAFNYVIDAAAAGNIVNHLQDTGSVSIQTDLNQVDFGAVADFYFDGQKTITVESDIFYDSIDALSFLATGDVLFNASVQNRNDTDGQINVVAGWDGASAFDPSTFLSADHRSTNLYGQNDGSVHLGDGSQIRDVAVGARSGNSTNVFGHDVSLQASDNGFAQLGFKVRDGRALDGTDLGAVPLVNGAINVRAGNEIRATGGSGRSDNFSQIGHVGADHTNSTTDEAMVDANIDVRAGSDIVFAGGIGTGAYAQLGHGGIGGDGEHSGSVTIRDSGNLVFSGGSGSTTYAMLGHGGYRENSGSNSGDILIENVGDLIFAGGDGFFAHVQIGHGDSGSNGGDDPHSGSLTIRDAGNLIFSGGDGQSHARLGHIVGSGDIFIENVGDVLGRGGRGTESFVQFGHSGDSRTGAASGSITLRDLGDLTFIAGPQGDAHVQLGHGGASNRSDKSGNILIEDAGDINFTGGVFESYAQIGHGGSEARGAHSGDVTIRNAGDISFSGVLEPQGDSSKAYLQIGHGGTGDSSGDDSGDILIEHVGDISFTTGDARAYAQIGHGGNGTFSGKTGSITLREFGDLTLTAGPGQESAVKIGHGGSFDRNGDDIGAIFIQNDGSIELTAGTSDGATAQIGHGGVHGGSADFGGSIDIITTGTLTLTGQDTAEQYTQIGHGDHPGDGDPGHSVVGNINIHTQGGANFTNAFIGHLIDDDGSYENGDTFLNIGGVLTTDANSQFFSAPAAAGGELRFYIPDATDDQVNAGALLNGVPHGIGQAPNNQGAAIIGGGSYTPDFSYYTLQTAGPVNYIVDAIAAENIGDALEGGGPVLLDVLAQFPDARFGAVIDADGGDQFIQVNSDLVYDSANAFTFLATGDIDITGNVQNSGAGSINLVGGWDETTDWDEATFLNADVANPGIYANNNGSVNINTGASVGSAGGNTNALGYDVNIDGGQLGFVTNGASAAADINVRAMNDTTVTSGQIGHSGSGAAMSGNISLVGGNGLTLTNSILGHGDAVGDGDAGQSVSGNISARLHRGIDLTNSIIGHRIDNDGTYASGNTFIGVGQTEPFLENFGRSRLTADPSSGLFSAPGGQFRIYMALDNRWRGQAGVNLNDAPVVPASGSVENLADLAAFGEGGYAPDPAIGNYVFYAAREAEFGAVADLIRAEVSNVNIEFVAPRPDLGFGTDLPVVVVGTTTPLSEALIQQLIDNPFFDFAVFEGPLMQLTDPYALEILEEEEEEEE